MGNNFNFFFSILILFIIGGCDIFDSKKREAKLCEDNLIEVYRNTSLNNFEKEKFTTLYENRLPLYKQMFENAAMETSLNSDLLAAISLKPRISSLSSRKVSPFVNCCVSRNRVAQSLDGLDRGRGAMYLRSILLRISFK